MIHLLAEHLIDLSDLLRSLGKREKPFPLTHGSEWAADGLGRKPRDIYIPDLRLGSGIKVPTRNYR